MVRGESVGSLFSSGGAWDGSSSRPRSASWGVAMQALPLANAELARQTQQKFHETERRSP
jgi:hypothetical protein